MCSFTDLHAIILLSVAFDSVTVRSLTFWPAYIRGLTYAIRNVRTQVKSTVPGPPIFQRATVKSWEGPGDEASAVAIARPANNNH